jgi:mercuric ion transport protein
MSAASPIQPQEPSVPPGSAPVLTLAAVAALLASACCVLPLLLAVLGISGAWISRLRCLEPYSGALMALAMAALGLAAWRIFRLEAQAQRACAAGDGACRTINATARRWFWLIAILTLIPLMVSLAAPLFY